MDIRFKWDGDMRFVAENELGTSLTIDTGPAYGGTGKHPTPMNLLIMALGGCMGMDMVSILRKMRVDITRFDIDIEAKRRSKEPQYFEEINMVFTISGDGLTEDKARRSADLSSEKYCSVSAMLREKAKITHDIKIE